MCEKSTEFKDHPRGWKIITEHGPVPIKTTVYMDKEGVLHTIQRVVAKEEVE